MDFRARLLRLGELQKRNDQPLAPLSDAADPPLEALVDGEWVSSSGARCFVSEHLYPLGHDHGGLRLGDLHAVPIDDWAPFIIAEEGQILDPQQSIFVDIETTGLARGAGTYAFLVGLGFFEGEHFRLRQCFMPDYADEEALLDLVAEDLAHHRGLITFNGRCFDWPIIETRYVLAQREPPCGGSPHLDLLSLSRRLWRRTLPSCALASLETSVLGVRRGQDDVPGYLIPQLYQDYVRWGHTRPIARIFYHNLMDILSMVALAARAGKVICPSLRQEGDPLCDHISLGAFYEVIGRYEDASHAYRLALEHGHSAEDIAAASKRLSALLKRLGRYDEAMEIWRARIPGDEIYPYLELAKQLEHRLREYAEARHVIQEAITWVRTRDVLLGEQERQRLMADLRHRLARVDRRLAEVNGYDNPGTGPERCSREG